LEDELKTLHKVFTQKKNAIEIESNPNTSDEERNTTITNIDGILEIINATYNKEEEEEEEY
jgi:hypothetical protein